MCSLRDQIMYAEKSGTSAAYEPYPSFCDSETISLRSLHDAAIPIRARRLKMAERIDVEEKFGKR